MSRWSQAMVKRFPIVMELGSSLGSSAVEAPAIFQWDMNILTIT